jgi:amino acid transporter
VPDVNGTPAAGAFDVPYIWQHSLGSNLAEFLLFVIVAAQFFCGTANLTSASRIIWALSRDGAVPRHRLAPAQRPPAPAHALWLVVVFDIVWMLPTFADATIGYLVATSITVIALYSAYALPIFLRLRLGARFRQGAWTLGRHYRWVDSIALVLFGGWWLLSARHWFRGPVRPASFEELEAADRAAAGNTADGVQLTRETLDPGGG